MKTKSTIVLSARRLKKALWILLFIPFSLFAQEDQDSTTYHRHYEIGIAPSYDLDNVSRNGLTTYKLIQDAYSRGIQPKLPEKLGNVLGGVWSFSFSYLAMIWPHEFGHSLRAHQVGGHFNIHNVALPIPYTTMTLPDDVSFQSSALSITGGFEINYLTSRRIQDDFYEYNGLYNDELGMAFINKMMYPIYVSLVIPQDPKEQDTWINTGGDPVHFIMPVWQRYSNDEIFLSDGSVHPGLVDFYGQSALLATFYNLLDPAFYKQAAAAFGKVTDGKRPWYLIGNEHNGWSYGTMFNTSILGYEVFLNNYLKLNDRLYILRLKTGRPYKNNSITLSSPNIYTSEKIKIGALVEVWDQDIFGVGGMIHSDISYSISDKIDVNLQLGYKTEGSTIGRTVESNFIAWVGLKYNLNN
ncbi:hypothetical protein ACFLT1_06235 [Bacteroidota bacterium]